MRPEPLKDKIKKDTTYVGLNRFEKKVFEVGDVKAAVEWLEGEVKMAQHLDKPWVLNLIKLAFPDLVDK